MLKPFFLQVPSGKVFVNFSVSDLGFSARWVLYFPPFAEEMNKSRPMVSQMARQLSAHGVNVLIPDLYGTGDSEGDFGDADWNCWLADMRFLLEWLRQQGAESIIFLGLRSGCLLATKLLTSLPEVLQGQVSQLIFWQPVLSGEQHIVQFLRLRVAAAMMSGKKETVGELRAELDKQGVIEVSGYRVKSCLANQMSELRLADLSLPVGTHVWWFEVANFPDKPMSNMADKLVAQWRQDGAQIECKTILGEPFWATQEIAMAQSLLEVTTAVVSPPGRGKVENIDVAKDVSVEPDSVAGEQPLLFQCNGDELIGILHHSSRKSVRGVVLIVGGPQYRVGSHRQFVTLARELAASGVSVLRFDYRGMGDSEGKFVGFDGVSQDIRAAIDEFQRQCPEVKEYILWGLCDAATASSFYACQDPRVNGLVLLNPWVRSEQGEAKAFIKHYYLQRFFSKGFWRKVFHGSFNPGRSFDVLLEKFRAARTEDGAASSAEPLVDRMCVSLSDFVGEVLIILSGNDLTAAEFKDSISSSKGFQDLIDSKAFSIFEMPDSDHTFSKYKWKDRVAQETVRWIKSW